LGTYGLRSGDGRLLEAVARSHILAKSPYTRDLFCCLGDKRRSLDYAARWAASLGMTGNIQVMFLSPLGERPGEGVMQETVFGLTPSPNLSPKGERSLKGTDRIDT